MRGADNAPQRLQVFESMSGLGRSKRSGDAGDLFRRLFCQCSFGSQMRRVFFGAHQNVNTRFVAPRFRVFRERPHLDPVCSRCGSDQLERLRSFRTIRAVHIDDLFLVRAIGGHYDVDAPLIKDGAQKLTCTESDGVPVSLAARQLTLDWLPSLERHDTLLICGNRRERQNEDEQCRSAHRGASMSFLQVRRATLPQFAELASSHVTACSGC